MKPAARQAYALAHPIGRADGDPHEVVKTLGHTRKHATGLLMSTILAVDR